MPYQIAPSEIADLANLLETYYQEAMDSGIREAVNRIAQSQMGDVTAALDSVAVAWNSAFGGKSSDSFLTTAVPTMKQWAGVYFQNEHELAMRMSKAGEMIINGLLRVIAISIPVPFVGAAFASASSYLFNVARDEQQIREKAVARADSAVAKRSGQQIDKLFTNEVKAQQAIQKSIEHYKKLSAYIDTAKNTPKTFEEVITYPRTVAKVRMLTSNLKVALYQIRNYFEALEQRTLAIEAICAQYQNTLKTQMPGIVANLLNKSYEQGLAIGKEDFTKGKVKCPGNLTFVRPSKPGAATQIAARMAHAMATAYIDAQPAPMTRPRSTSFAPPPLVRSQSGPTLPSGAPPLLRQNAFRKA